MAEEGDGVVDGINDGVREDIEAEGGFEQITYSSYHGIEYAKAGKAPKQSEND